MWGASRTLRCFLNGLTPYWNVGRRCGLTLTVLTPPPPNTVSRGRGEWIHLLTFLSELHLQTFYRQKINCTRNWHKLSHTLRYKVMLEWVTSKVVRDIKIKTKSAYTHDQLGLRPRSPAADVRPAASLTAGGESI